MSGTRPAAIGAIWAQTPDRRHRPRRGDALALPEDMALFTAHDDRPPGDHGPAHLGVLPGELPAPARTDQHRHHLLPGRVARGEDPGAVLTTPYAEAVRLARTSPGAERIWVIGGGEVYRQALADAEHPRDGGARDRHRPRRRRGHHAPVLDDGWATERGPRPVGVPHGPGLPDRAAHARPAGTGRRDARSR